MKINMWLKKHKRVTLKELRIRRTSNIEWNKICKEYETYCNQINIKPDYDLFNQHMNLQENPRMRVVKKRKVLKGIST